MKVAVITRHAIANYGSLLQAIATQKVIEDLGYSCEIIDYIRDDESYSKLEKTLLKRKNKWNKNAITRLFYLIIRQPISIAVGKKFEKERLKYLKMTDRCSNVEQLKELVNANVYMTGSDQVWGPVADGSFDSAYCLSFTNNNEKRVAYAASFGHTEMSDEMKDFFKIWLKRYNCITVREDSAIELMKRFGISANQVLDPTLLLNFEYWKEYLEPISNKKYILIYQLHNNKKLGEYAKKVAKAKGLQLIRISTSFHQVLREGRFIWAPSISKFLSYVKNAECMITDSFHGTAFAINFNVPFIEILPNNGTGTRNLSILKMTGLEDRILRDENNLDLIYKEIDFLTVNQILENKRKESIVMIKSMVEN